MNLHGISTQLKRAEERLGRTDDALLPVKMFELPHDCCDADTVRFEKEIQAKYPVTEIIVINFVAPNKIDGGFLHPGGRKLDEGETWQPL